MPEKIDLETKKEVAKIAMTATLGVTVLTAPFLKGNRTLKNIHTGAGALFAGFSLWHHLLYRSDKKKGMNPKKAEKSTPECEAHTG